LKQTEQSQTKTTLADGAGHTFKGGGLLRGVAPNVDVRKRPKNNRDELHYPSDLTDDEWSHLELIIPPAKRGARKHSVEPREVPSQEWLEIDGGVISALFNEANRR
jgi:hypothetical protein